jgi:hypothetical protein
MRADCIQNHILNICVILCHKWIYDNKSTANGTKYTRQIFKEAMILTFD